MKPARWPLILLVCSAPSLAVDVPDGLIERVVTQRLADGSRCQAGTSELCEAGTTEDGTVVLQTYRPGEAGDEHSVILIAPEQTFDSDAETGERDIVSYDGRQYVVASMRPFRTRAPSRPEISIDGNTVVVTIVAY